jgi:hypothetical protein
LIRLPDQAILTPQTQFAAQVELFPNKPPLPRAWMLKKRPKSVFLFAPG